jgi:hypothetical protein
MLNARMLALQGVGYAPFAMAVMGSVPYEQTIPRFFREEGVGPDAPVLDWRFGIHPALRKTGDQVADLQTHLLELTAIPLKGETEMERQDAKLARTFGLATPAGRVEIPLFKPAIGQLPKKLLDEMAAYAERVREEVRDERHRIILLLAD